MKIDVFLKIACCTLFICSCSPLTKTSNNLPSDIYKTSKSGTVGQIIYVENKNDTVKVYHQNASNRLFNSQPEQIFATEQSIKKTDNIVFYKNSLDVDFITIPFKYRPGQQDLPRQFTTNLNGAVFLGRRTDRYDINYTQNPLQKYSRNQKHYAFSFGVFSGLGSTAMNPSVTNQNIQQEYDGLVWTKGVAGIVGINNFTVGFAIGFDNLLDQNRKSWIFEQKMWYGLAFGLNLN